MGVNRSWQLRSAKSMISSACSWSNKSNRGVDENQTNSSFVFPEKADERSSGFSMNNLSSPLSDGGLTPGVSCEWSTMGASIDEDTHAESWMACSPKTSGNNGGGLERRESSFTNCWCSSSQSYSSWMTTHVGCETPTPLMAWSLFTTSVESGMDEHKTVSSAGSFKYEDRVCGTECLWQLDGLTTKSVRRLSEVMLGGCDSWTDVCAHSLTSL